MGKVTGTAVAEAMLELQMEVRVVERDEGESTAESAAQLRRQGVEVIFDDKDVALAEWADLVVPSPGVPPSNLLLAAALDRGIPIWSEIEVGWRLARGPVLAITGTNGKTTTTKLLTEMLQRASIPAVSAGNIGFPLVQAARAQGKGSVLVTEVSSFQLAYIDTFSPRVAVVLNVADDHYDWHGSYAEYLASKTRITENQGPSDLLLVGSSDAACISIASRSPAQLGVFGLESPESLAKHARDQIGREAVLVAGLVEDKLLVSTSTGDTEICRKSDIPLTGAHNLENVLAAAAAAFRWIGKADSIRQAVQDFEPLPHRMALVAEKNGIRYIDDSKATNPHSALAALKGMTNVILLAGGRSKGISLSPLVAAKDACKAVVVMGEAAGELKSVFQGIAVREAANVEEAVWEASQIARPGDTVLLSPGCSSLDQYSDYAERGDRFSRAVQTVL